MSASSLAEILTIRGNRAVFEAFKGLLALNRGVAFVGAGASAALYPAWSELIDRLADHALSIGKAETRDRDRWKEDRTTPPQQRVSTILRKLGDDHYHQFLHETFGPRRGPDGRPYTPTHAALLRLPFRGFVTTNYDPGLDFARMDLRQKCLTTDTPTWQDDNEVHRWLTAEVFGAADACPILWLHGYWQRPKSIVLNVGEYANAYRPGLYRKTFERLWLQDHLVFAGYGFNDPQFTFMVGEILRDIGGAEAPARHIAILGLRRNGDGSLPDPDTIAERRDGLERDFHVRALFYPVGKLPNGGEDHGGLLALLDASAADQATGTTHATGWVTPSWVTPSTLVSDPLPSRWVHETTDDDKFSGRQDECARLDRWVGDDTVRAIGICAIGGTGKTALVGHWLKSQTGWNSRRFAGVFAWSFYQQRETAAFLQSLIDWARETWATDEHAGTSDPVNAALDIVKRHPLVIVLDGLEVLQEGPEHARYGVFLDRGLREFLGRFCSRRHGGLAVLTSRFVFADLERHLGTAFRQLDLPGLTPPQGAALLDELDVRGHPDEREDVSRRLEGHPLALRVFAEAISEADRHRPRFFLSHAFDASHISADSPLAGKLKRLLVFYEKTLPREHVWLLSVVALFRTPVPEPTIVRLVRHLFTPKSPNPPPDDAALSVELRRLQARGIVTYEPLSGAAEEGGYASHPVLRDYFRSVLLGTSTEVALEAANMLAGPPAVTRPRSSKQIEPVLWGIELLLDGGDVSTADVLYRDRLADGKVFQWLPAASEGLRCALGFVRDDARVALCRSKLFQRRTSFYLNSVGLFASMSGDFERAAEFYAVASVMDRNAHDWKNLGAVLRNQANLFVRTGRLKDARTAAAQAIDVARSQEDLIDSTVEHAWVRQLAGELQAAAEDFCVARTLENELNPIDGDFYGRRGVAWSEFLVRCGQHELARLSIIKNLNACVANELNTDVARCQHVLAKCELVAGLVDAAATNLGLAKAVFQEGQLLFDLARVHVMEGEVHLASDDPAGALERADEALVLAEPRGMRLVQADALVLRGRARLRMALEGAGGIADPETRAPVLSRIIDDAEASLRLARESGYLWAEHDALALMAKAGAALTEVLEQLKRGEAAAHHRRETQRAETDLKVVRPRLRLGADDLAKAAEVATTLRALIDGRERMSQIDRLSDGSDRRKQLADLLALAEIHLRSARNIGSTRAEIKAFDLRNTVESALAAIGKPPVNETAILPSKADSIAGDSSASGALAPVPSMQPQAEMASDKSVAGVFGRYRIIDRIDQDEMAETFRAVADGVEGSRVVSLKRLRPRLSSDKEAVAHFIDNARLQASLVHSNIVPVFEVGVNQGQYFLTADYIAGRDVVRLIAACHRKTLALIPRGLVYYVAHEVLRGLQYVHNKRDREGQAVGIVHRDVSPYNILVSLTGEVKLTGFGIAKSSAQTVHTRVGMVKGNANFMSPEQARGMTVDERSDLFSMALCLHYCLTNRLLYDGDNDLDVLFKAATGPTKGDLEELRKLAPPAADLLSRALALDPAERFQTASEFADALAPHAEGGKVEATRLMQLLFGNEIRDELS